MQETLAPGLEIRRSFTVSDEMSPRHLPAKVLSTPAMIELIEGTCLALAQPHLDEGETSVGTHVDVSHTGPAMSGEEVTVHARLADREKRRLTFEVEVRSPRGPISGGTHRRAVVDLARFSGAGP